jgi:hypothetical protein
MLSSVSYVINGHTYTKGYYLADGIHPQWSTIVKTNCEPYLENKNGLPSAKRVVGRMLSDPLVCSSSVFAIVWNPALQWSIAHIWEIMNACVIIHNMIIESERDNAVHDDLPYD